EDMLGGRMRWMALAAALLVATAICAPIAAAASDDPMPCCMGEGAAMCCPFDGAGTWKACPGSRHEAPPTGLTVFALPATEALDPPSAGAPSARVPGLSQEILAGSLPDPPPRA
ncbi:MAG TPA: hypothetical protein VKE50_03790, partial [Thermoanaerobaculia bacterium]|nr:hypothetical protein [Thermoanaerobaculia bacterium]